MKKKKICCYPTLQLYIGRSYMFCVINDHAQQILCKKKKSLLIHEISNKHNNMRFFIKIAIVYV